MYWFFCIWAYPVPVRTFAWIELAPAPTSCVHRIIILSFSIIRTLLISLTTQLLQNNRLQLSITKQTTFLKNISKVRSNFATIRLREKSLHNGMANVRKYSTADEECSSHSLCKSYSTMGNNASGLRIRNKVMISAKLTGRLASSTTNTHQMKSSSQVLQWKMMYVSYFGILYATLPSRQMIYA